MVVPTHGGTLMKYGMGTVLALVLGLSLAASAQANNIKSRNTTPNIQNGSTEQIQPRKQRVTKQRIGKSHLAMRHQPKGKIAVAKLNRHHRIAIAHNHKLGKTRLATLNRHNRHQTVGVGSSTPSTGTNVMPQAPNQAPNSAGGTPSTNQ